MEISLTSSIDQFDKLRDAWNTVYSADPHATVHRSWAWLRGWIESTSYNPLVLAVRQNTSSPYVAFLVLGIEPNAKNRGELYLGGHSLSAHTGFVCVPRYAEEAIPTFSSAIQNQLNWYRFVLRDVFDPRLSGFIKCFSLRKFDIQQVNPTLCHYLPLPNSWDQYLREFLSWKTRKSLRYCLRQIERYTDLRCVTARTENLENYIETLLTLWLSRWGPKPEEVLDQIRAIFRRCFESKSLWLTILWDGATPLSGMAAYVDQQKKTFSPFLMAYNEQFAKFSPGKVVLAHSIRYAIEHEFRMYDFGRGTMEYKFSLGAKERFNTNLIIVRKNLRTKVKNQISRLKNCLPC